MSDPRPADVADANPQSESKSSAWTDFGRRRRYFIDPRFQGGLLAAAFVQLTTFIVVLTAGIFLPLILAVLRGKADSVEMVEAARHMIALDAHYWPALFGAFGLMMILALRTSHKIAGPLYRFRRVFEAILADQDPGRVKLRKGDYLIPEAEFLDRVVRHVVADRQRLDDFRRQTELLLGELDLEDEASPERVRNLVERRLAGLLAAERGR